MSELKYNDACSETKSGYFQNGLIRLVRTLQVNIQALAIHGIEILQA